MKIKKMEVNASETFTAMAMPAQVWRLKIP